MNVETFNARYPVGTPVFAYPGFRPEDASDARRLVTRTRTAAQMSASGDAVVWVEGEGSYICLTHVDPVSEEQFAEARVAETAAAVAELGALPVPVGDQPQPLDDQRLAEALAAYEGHPDLGFACCSAHAVVDHVPALLADNARLRAEVAELKEQRERRRLRLIALQNDALSMRGSLAPADGDRKVPFELGETLTPAVDWLIARVAELEKRDDWLSVLEAAGVDNWEGYDDALEIAGEAS